MSIYICMARDIVKLRKVAGSMVVSIPQSVLSEMRISEGDRFLIESVSATRLLITKEMKDMPNVQKAELELVVLQAKKAAHESTGESLCWQHNNSMELDPRLADEHIFELEMLERRRQAAELDVEIARKRLEIFELQGSIPVSQ
jgi:hypothetical protein